MIGGSKFHRGHTVQRVYRLSLRVRVSILQMKYVSHHLPDVGRHVCVVVDNGTAVVHAVCPDVVLPANNEELICEQRLAVEPLPVKADNE